MSYRIDALDKLSGTAKYIADMIPEKCLFASILRSPIAKGKLINLEFNSNFDWSKVTFITHKDVLGENKVPFVKDEMPLFAENRLNFIGEAIGAVASISKKLSDEAIKHIKIIYEEEKPVIGFDSARIANEVLFETKIQNDNFENALKLSPIIIEGEYKTGFQEQAYIETQGMLAIPDKKSIQIIGSMQCPYYILSALERILGFSKENISVKQSVVGGAFGGKEDYPSHMAGYVSLLALKTKKPVILIYDRREDIKYTTKRHPSIIKHKTGIDKNGKLLCMDIKIELDGGAYTTLSPVVISRALLHSYNVYNCPIVRAHGVVWKTNIPPTGAFRGFGAPQAIFAIEKHIDNIAKKLGISPYDIRKINAYKIGDTTPTGQILKESVSALELLEDVTKKSSFERKWKEYTSPSPLPQEKDGRVKKGIGISLSMHGGGFTGSGENKIKGKARLRVVSSNLINIEVSSTEMGQGSHTVLAQIASNVLNLDLETVKVIIPDTKICPDSGPTVASRTTMVVGKIIYDCANELKSKFSEFGSGKEALAKFFEKDGETIIESQYELPSDTHFDDDKMKGDAYPVYSWGATVAEVEVNTDTGEIDIKDIWVSIDCGKVINKTLAEGQVEGGTVQAIGYSTIEYGTYQNGLWNTNGLETYMIPSTKDIPPIHLNFIENEFSYGPYGAKGLGELPLDGPAGAIANAVSQAINKNINSIPISPEQIVKEINNE